MITSSPAPLHDEPQTGRRERGEVACEDQQGRWPLVQRALAAASLRRDAGTAAPSAGRSPARSVTRPGAEAVGDVTVLSIGSSTTCCPWTGPSRPGRPSSFHGRAIDSPGRQRLAAARGRQLRYRRPCAAIDSPGRGHGRPSARFCSPADRVDRCRRQAAPARRPGRAANWRSHVIEAYAEGAALHDSIGLAQHRVLRRHDAACAGPDCRLRGRLHEDPLPAARGSPDDEARMRVADTLGSLQALLSAITAERASGRDLQARAARRPAAGCPSSRLPQACGSRWAIGVTRHLLAGRRPDRRGGPHRPRRTDWPVPRPLRRSGRGAATVARRRSRPGARS